MPDPAKRTVGTLVLKGPNGGDIDLIANRSIHSGEIAAYLEMRDQVLVEAQAQLDEIAATMARALSDRTVAGNAGDRRGAGGFRYRPGLAAQRQSGPGDLHRQPDEHPAWADASAGRRSGGAAASRHRHHRSK